MTGMDDIPEDDDDADDLGDDLGQLLDGIDEPDLAPPETDKARRARLHAARVDHVNAAFARGRRALLARALDPQNGWSTIEPQRK